MKKTFGLALLITVSIPCITLAQENKVKTVKPYELSPETEAISKLNKSETSAVRTENFDSDAKPSAHIVRENLSPKSYREKLLNEKGLPIASKTIQNNDVIQKELMFYYPNDKLQRKVTLVSDGTEFYAEDYYMNGKISSQANYLNEKNKIGKERKYDSNGTLRQEIEWVIVKGDNRKSLAERHTVRKGQVITYYPNGRVAALFSVGKAGENKYFDTDGNLIKEINDVEILNFTNEINPEDCSHSVVQLSLEDLVALYEDEGDISYNKCGLPYRENFTNEVVDLRGNTATKISFDETGMIRKITPYIGGRKEGLEQKFDSNGNLTAEVNYVAGIKSGMASGYFPTKEKAFRKRYENGKIVGSLNCYFPNGEKAAEFHYKNGKKEGIANIYGSQARTIEFKDDKIQHQKNKKKQIPLSKLSEVTKPEEKCLNIDNKLEKIEQDIKAQVKAVKDSFQIDIPFVCRDMESFKSEASDYVCYDSTNRLRAIYPTAYHRGRYARESIYSKNGDLVYEIPYNDKKRQGFTRQYDKMRQVVAEIYFDKGELAETSRIYYPNGTTQTMMTIESNRPHKFMVQYNKEGKPTFSINYNKGVRSDAYIADKDVERYIKFNQNKVENFRESEPENIYNYTDYNLILGEYIKYQNNHIIGGGKICGYEEKTTAVKTSDPENVMASTEVKEKKTETVINTNKHQPESEDTKTPANLKLPQTEAKTISQPQTELLTGKTDKIMPTEKMKVIETPKAEAKPETVVKPQAETKPEPEYEELAPIMSLEEAPLVEGLEEIEETDFKVKNAIIPTKAEKKQAELASQNIGPVAKPDIHELTDTVTKIKGKIAPTANSADTETLSHTEKFYYPNGKIRKTVTTRGNRTEEIKEYSKNGLMITDKQYQADKKIVEKYYGSGEIRRKTLKGYDDNAILAFISREDFYNNGNIRYEIMRHPSKMLFTDKNYDTKGNMIRENIQKRSLSFSIKEFSPDGKIIKQIEQEGSTKITIEYNQDNKIKSVTLNGTKIPAKSLPEVMELLKENRKFFGKNNNLQAEFKVNKQNDILVQYYPNGKVETEITYFDNGEISVKIFDKGGMLEKFAYLSPDGRLHIQKPEIRIIPSYRERYWIDYNNPYWIENRDKYTIMNIGRLNLDIVSYILAELEAEVPDIIKTLYKQY